MKSRICAMSVPKELENICSVGKHSYTDGGSPNIVIHKIHAKLSIGSFVSIGPHCNIFLGSEHRTDFISTFTFSRVFDNIQYIECIKTKGNVEIGSDVWIGANVTILSGVTIGHGAVIGAGSMVTKNIEPYTIVAGNPIRTIRKRFTDQQIEKLLKLKWWEWPDEKIANIATILMSDNVDMLVGDIYDTTTI